MATMAEMVKRAESRKRHALAKLKRAERVTARLIHQRRPINDATMALRAAGRSVPQSMWEKREAFQKKLAKAGHVEHEAREAYEAVRRAVGGK